MKGKWGRREEGGRRKSEGPRKREEGGRGWWRVNKKGGGRSREKMG